MNGKLEVIFWSKYDKASATNASPSLNVTGFATDITLNWTECNDRGSVYGKQLSKTGYNLVDTYRVLLLP